MHDTSALIKIDSLQFKAVLQTLGNQTIVLKDSLKTINVHSGDDTNWNKELTLVLAIPILIAILSFVVAILYTINKERARIRELFHSTEVWIEQSLCLIEIQLLEFVDNASNFKTKEFSFIINESIYDIDWDRILNIPHVNFQKMMIKNRKNNIKKEEEMLFVTIMLMHQLKVLVGANNKCNERLCD